MRFAITADWHLFNYQSGKQEEIIQTIYNMIHTCNDMKINTIIVAGDIFHGKSVIHSISLSHLLDIFRNNRSMNFIVVDGNHDLSGRNEQVTSALRCLDYEPNVCRIEKSEKVNDILFVPYSYNMVETITSSTAKYLVSHLGVNEAVLNSGISVVSDIKMKDFEGKYHKIFLGHYHKPQKISSNNVTLYYCGSPTQLDWGECNDIKRFLVLDTNLDKVSSVETTGYKKHIKIHVTEKNYEEMLVLAKEERNNGNYVRIETSEKISDLTKFLEDDFQIINKSKQDLTDRGIDTGMSDREKLEKYLEIKKIKTDDYKKYLNVALDIIKE